MIVLLQLLAGARLATAATFDTGTFRKQAALGSQTVPHALGEVPRALILWTGGNGDENVNGDYTYCLGMTDGVTSRALAAASKDQVGSSVAGRRLASAAITIVRWDQNLIAEADFVSWDASGFTVSWTANVTAEFAIHYLAIGGSGVSARVLPWTMRSGSTGNQAVTGVGFRPALVLSAHIGAGFTSAPPASSPQAVFGLGAMDGSGHEWATAFLTDDGSSTSDTKRYQRTDKAIVAMTDTGAVAKEAGWVSMDPDGFTVGWTDMDSSASRAVSLALSGVAARVGSFDKTTAAQPATQTVAGLPFAPQAVLLASFQNIASAVSVPHSRLGVGAATLAGSAAFACSDNDLSPTTKVKSVDKASRAFTKLDNGGTTLDAEASLAGFGSGSFVLDWTTNDPVATEMLYVALGSRRRIWMLTRDLPAEPPPLLAAGRL